jgi:hypothetical protein
MAAAWDGGRSIDAMVRRRGGGGIVAAEGQGMRPEIRLGTRGVAAGEVRG